MEDDTDRALAAKDARIAELEREVANVSAAALAQKMLADSLRMSLEAVKAARVKAVEEEREACAKALEAWADSEDREALLKRPDAPCSAESHEESAIIARRHAGLIRARGGQ